MTDRTGLAGDAADGDAALDVELLVVAGQREGLTDDQLQRFKTEVVIDVTAVDRDLAAALIQANAGNGGLPAAGAVEKRSGIVIHYR